MLLNVLRGPTELLSCQLRLPSAEAVRPAVGGAGRGDCRAGDQATKIHRKVMSSRQPRALAQGEQGAGDHREDRPRQRGHGGGHAVHFSFVLALCSAVHPNHGRGAAEAAREGAGEHHQGQRHVPPGAVALRIPEQPPHGEEEEDHQAWDPARPVAAEEAEAVGHGLVQEGLREEQADRGHVLHHADAVRPQLEALHRVRQRHDEDEDLVPDGRVAHGERARGDDQ
eukprot:CAMPEP_0195073356 /NCGR_PEP_ID=MMETSP0448-20130528/16704_1 /TAXON_ID=66468 /ORGANISM="Heterocapsa triquestra, Strain CCMP 448" /LENGTH=225 /DNA_ID=CAMNT_0040105455 /DNA_START=47 /DNA_END=721 /DNA_ORIENTATION=-